MGNISDAILMGNVTQEEPKNKNSKVSVADQVLGIPKIEREYSETETISTITGKPEVEWTPTGQSGPSMGAAIKTGFVDDPQTKINIYAKSRGIPPDRYRIIDNEIVFQADNGKWYSEEPTMGAGKLKSAAGNIIAHSPSIAMGALGATAGPGTAALGAAGGEAIRKVVGATVFDEPQTTMGNVKDISLEGALGYVSGGSGKVATRGIKRIGKALGGRTAKHAGRAVESIDMQAAKNIAQAGKDVGIDLTVPQATGSKRLADKFNLLGDSEATAEIIQAARKKQQKQINDAVYKFLNVITPEQVTRKGSGGAVVEAAEKGIFSLRSARSKLSKKLYDKSLKARGLDISDTIKTIDDIVEAAPRGGKERIAAKRIKRMLTREIESPSGKKMTVAEDRLRVIDKVKKEINSMWKKDPQKAPDKEAQRSLNDILNKMLKGVDDAVPEYKEARSIYAQASPKVAAQEKGIVGELSKLEGDKVTRASKKLFSSIDSSPETVLAAKKLITKQDPEAWNGALKTYLKDIFEQQKESAGGVDVVTNIGGMFYKRTWGDPQKRAILNAAMNKGQKEYFKKLSSVLERAGMILRKESATATRQQMQREIAGTKTSRFIETATRPMRTKERVIGDWVVSHKFDVNAQKLAEALISTKGMKQLDRMYRMSDKSSKLIPSLTAFFGLIGGAELKRAHGTKNAK